VKIFLIPALVMMAFAVPVTAAYASDPDSPEFWAILEGKPYAGAPDPGTVSEPAVIQHKAAHRTFLAQRGHHVRRPVAEPANATQ